MRNPRNNLLVKKRKSVISPKLLPPASVSTLDPRPSAVVGKKKSSLVLNGLYVASIILVPPPVCVGILRCAISFLMRSTNAIAMCAGILPTSILNTRRSGARCTR